MSSERGWRPAASILHDHHALHRDWFTGEPTGDTHPTEWDYILADVYQIIEDNTNKHGHLRWEADSDLVAFDAKKRIDKAQAAIDRKTRGGKNKPYEPSPGEYWVTSPVLKNPDGKWPTLEDWYKQEAKKNGKKD